MLPQGKVLCDFFVGSGVTMLNTDFERYILSDINPHLIRLYKTLQERPGELIDLVDSAFTQRNNESDVYYQARKEFNRHTDISDPTGMLRSSLLVWLNRHGYNGLMRLNGKGELNVPFGSYKAVHAPLSEMEVFAQKAKRATFYCRDYAQSFIATRHLKSHTVYLDPPYAEENKKKKVFTGYAGNRFDLKDQVRLTGFAKRRGIKTGGGVVISNHDTEVTRALYKDAVELASFTVHRSISCNTKGRVKANELLARFG
ncbi:Dam family site-specific DNA-(adenine-N6)-methyltransferase [Colwellia sp. MSW7]|uniref:Dam family site-specific DNA-(Adenine-N6)-methyltransferase n=2 Tax=Colwellia maritima TaxID=2912588 RepID=A0ABS9X8E7_9GAMM|nr:Dam family site-specific DNA-(adenine-N6)-methyltransferase [Colwellia maritima]